MTERMLPVIGPHIELWSGVKVPNDAARVLASQLDAVLQGFEELRGTLQFEDEPSSFEAALLETKDRE